VIHVIRQRATPQQVAEMLEALESYIKAALLDNGSRPEGVWGADWIPATQQVRFEALINIRPGQSNPSVTILNPGIRAAVEKVVRDLLERV